MKHGIVLKKKMKQKILKNRAMLQLRKPEADSREVDSQEADSQEVDSQEVDSRASEAEKPIQPILMRESIPDINGLMKTALSHSLISDMDFPTPRSNIAI